MNIDIFSQFQFGDREGLGQFLLAHRFVHNQTSEAVAARFGTPYSTYGLTSSVAERQWAAMMKDEIRQTPEPLKDWLKLHADMHISTYALLGQTPTTAPDLSVVDFSSRQQFDDWMYAHQQMHDFEFAQLGLS